jgi:hypothetical protein
MTERLRRSVPALLAALAVGASACGGTTIDSGKLEDEIADQLGIQVVCPDDQDAEEGNEFTCTGVSVAPPEPGAVPQTGPPETQTVTVRVEVLNDDGDVRFEAE